MQLQSEKSTWVAKKSQFWFAFHWTQTNGYTIFHMNHFVNIIFVPQNKVKFDSHSSESASILSLDVIAISPVSSSCLFFACFVGILILLGFAAVILSHICQNINL